MRAEQIKVTDSEFEEPIKRISKDDWFAKGRELFGDDPQLWKFKCACCGHVQTIADFIQLRSRLLWDGDAHMAYHTCIGGCDPRIPEKDLGKFFGRRKSPCDYALAFSISLAKTVVVDGDGNEYRVFEFATD